LTVKDGRRKSLDKIHDETEYYDHQLDGIRKMAGMGSFLLADEMGLGKSLQALTVAAIDFQRGWAKNIIVVCPATLKWNWEDEVKKFTKFDCMILDGTPEERAQQLELFKIMELDVLIVNYEQVRAHVDTLNSIGFSIAIYDEAHYIKNYKSKRTKATLRLKADRHFVLTGSPLLNQVNELWPILHRIDPGQFPDYWRFVNKFAVYGGYQNKQIVGVKNRPTLNAAIDKVMIRRLKKDVLDLPEKQIIQKLVDLSPLQRKLYDQAAEDMQIDLPTGDPMEFENALVKYLYLKQICGTAATIEGYEDESTKLDMVEELVDDFMHDEPDAPAKPVVIFTQFRKVQAACDARLQARGIPTFILNGDTPKETRQEIIKTWADHKPVAALIVMTQMAVGFNATAADKCIFIDKLYVPKLNEQAQDRLHRIGADTTKPIQIFEIIARKTVEQRIESILKRKTKLFDSLVEESDWKKALYEALQAQDDEE
jgi:SNF2 family DNA or RNA helicase